MHVDAAHAMTPPGRSEPPGARPTADIPTASLRARARWLLTLAVLAGMPVAMAQVPTPRPAPTPTQRTSSVAPIPDFAATSLSLGSCCYINSIASVDLNGDGYNDVVTGNGLSYDFSVLLGNAAGGFADRVNYPVGDAEMSRVVLAIGDLDGDGHADIVATGTTASGLWLYRGDGQGALGAAQTLSLGAGTLPEAVEVADVDGNGRLDIVTANSGSSDVSVLLGDGAGGFATTRNFAIAAGPRALAVGDVDGDGHADLVSTSGEAGVLSLVSGNGSGGFAPPVLLPVGSTASPFDVAIADVDGDGHHDLVTSNAGADGTPYPPAELPGSVSLLRGNGKGGFHAPLQIALDDVPGRAHAVAVADLTADGHLDIAVTHTLDNAVTVLVGDGSGGFATRLRRPTGVAPGPLAVADVTADGHLDVVTGNDDSVSVLPGDGAGGVGFSGNFVAGATPFDVSAVELDGDGHVDVLAANFDDNTVSVLLGNGSGGLIAAGVHPVGSNPTTLATTDLDGDGDLDAVVGNFGSGDVSVLLSDGSGGFADSVAVSVGAPGFEGPYAVALGDANGDGHPDVATVNTSIEGESISVLLGDGAGGLSTATIHRVGPNPYNGPQGILLADVTGDGHADIVTANVGSSTLSLLVGDGAGGFADARLLAAGAGPVAVKSDDVNGDGHPDLVSLDTSGQTVSVLAGNGSGSFAAAQSWPIAPAEAQELLRPFPWDLALADIDGDGAADIVTANTQTNTVSVLVNDGGGAYPAFRMFGTGARPGAVDVADIDGDGRVDVITANRANRNVSVLFAGDGAGAGLADLAVVVDATPASVAPGQLMTFEAALGNAGPDAATFPGIGFALDAELADFAVVAPLGWSCDDAQVEAGATSVACTTATLPSGGTAAFVATAIAPASAVGNAITLTTAATATTGDPVPGDNSDNVSVPVQAPADLAVAIDGPERYVRGTVVAYTIDLDNLGPAPAAQAVLDIAIGVPAASVAIMAPAGWTCVPGPTSSTYAASCTRAGTVPVGGTTFVAAVTIASRRSPPRFTVRAAAASAAEDPHASNDVATRSARLGRAP